MELIIRNTTNQPIYDQIYSQIKAQIIAGKLSPGEALPSIREQKLKELEDHLDAAVELAAQCGVSALELMEMLRILLKEEEPHV